MRKISISYINKNKVTSSLKLICVGTAFMLVTSCSVNNNNLDVNNSFNINDYSNELSSVIYEETKINEDISILDETSQGIETSRLEKNESIINEEISKLDDESNVDIKVSEPKDERPIENEVSDVIEEEIVNIDIGSIILSENEVSVYNTNYEISGDLRTKINSYINNFGADSSFIAINLNDGMSFGYNIDKVYQTASTIKAAFSLYCFKEMDKGNGTLDELKLYEERFRRDGSGVLRNKESGTYYSLRDLFYYTINYSDNVAYYMVHDRFYSEAYNVFLSELGCKELYLRDGAKWGYIDARSIALIWQELYKYKDESENGKYLFELLTNAEYNYIREGMENYESAHKSGWTPRETHDTGIVFASDDYIVVTLNNNNGNYTAKRQLLKICGCIEEVIDEYTLYKTKNKSIQKTLSR